jgi:hypothetical protein
MTKTTTTIEQLTTVCEMYRKDYIAEWQSYDFISEDEVRQTAKEMLAVDLSDLAEYTIKLTGSMKTSDGEAFTMTISRNGEEIIWVENEGRGGSNLYRWSDYAHMKAYSEACQKAWPYYPFEVEDHATLMLDLLYIQKIL